MMFIFGGLFLMLGTCESINAFSGNLNQVMTQEQSFLRGSSNGQSLPINTDQLKTSMILFAAMFLIAGLGYILLAVGVRRGGKTSTILATILTGLIAAGVALMMLATLVASLAMPVLLALACVMLIPAGLLVPLMTWLIKAMRAQPHLASAQQQYMAQYWQYQQNMQAYSGGYGYAGQVQPTDAPKQIPPPG